MTESLTLRPRPRPADLAAVDALLARSYPRLLAADYPPSVLVTALPLISRARPELLAVGTYWVALSRREARLSGRGAGRRARPTEPG